MQAHVSPTIGLTVAADGTITLDPANINFQAGELCVDASNCLATDIVGSGPTQTGTIDPAAGTISLDVQVQVELDDIGVGFSGLGSDCRIGPVSGTLTGTDYDQSDGSATLTANDLTVPAVSTCGGFLGLYNTLINAALDLPGEADVVFLTTTVNGSNVPVQG